MWRPLAAPLALLTLAALALTSAPASAAPAQRWQRCAFGSGGGQCKIPRGVVASPAIGHIYAADQANDRIDEFTAWGEFVKTWGWDVVASGPGDDTTPPENQFEVCIPARGDTCKAGVKGGGRGQLVRPQGLALDSSGDLYVVEGDFTNRRVQKFDPASGAEEKEAEFVLMFGGKVNKTKVEAAAPPAEQNLCPIAPTDVCQTASEGSGNGEFGPFVLGSFIAIAPGDKVWVGDEGRIQRFDTAGAYQSQISLPGETVKALAAEPSGNLYVAACTPGSCAGGKPAKANVRKFSSAGTLLGTITVADPYGLATDAVGNLYLLDGVENPTIRKFTTAGTEVKDAEFPFTAGLGESTGIAANTVTEAGGIGFYLANATEKASFLRAYGAPPLKWPRPEVPPSVDAQYATAVSTDSAVLRAQINPRFWEDTRYYVEYGSGKCSEGGCTQTQPPLPGSLLTNEVADRDFTTNAVFLAGLAPATTYHYRFAAKGGGGEASGGESTFRTLPDQVPPSPECPNRELRSGPSAELPDCRAYELVTPVRQEGDIFVVVGHGGHKIRLDQATVDGGKLTYSTDAAAFAGPQAAPVIDQYLAARDPASGWSSRSVSPPRSSVFLDEADLFESQFKAFSPDLCRAWFVQDSDLALVPEAPLGVKNLYQADLCGEDGYRLLTTQSPPEPEIYKPGNLYQPTFQGASAGRSTAIFADNAPLTPDASSAIDGSGLPILQLYGLDEAGGLHLASVMPDGSASDLQSSLGTRNGSPGNYTSDSVQHALSADGTRAFWTASTTEESNAGQIYLRLNPTQPPSALAHGAGIGIGDLSAGSATVGELFAAKGKAAFTAGQPTVNLLETEAGEFLPGLPVSAPGKIPAGTTILSVSGSTLTLSANATASSPSFSIKSTGPAPFAVGQNITGPGIAPETTIIAAAPGSLALSNPATATLAKSPLEAFSDCTEAAKACTLPVSGQVSSANANARFAAAAADGSRAFFTIGSNLYEFDTPRAIAHEATPAQLIAEGVVGSVMGQSENASRLYFASSKDLSPGPELENPLGREPVPGQPNLYLYERGGGLAFVGTLSGEDLIEANGESPSPLARYPSARTSRITPDGLHAAFDSSAPLTAYDNADAASGHPDQEAFIYDAATGGEEAQLHCASCNPTGARPVGRQQKEGEQNGLRAWSSALIPGWPSEFQPSRALSEGGRRLFFESYDALAPGDSNGAGDVYEWEAAETGAPGTVDCSIQSTSFSEANEGCLSLISSGSSPKDVELLDASADGSDVFIQTAASLLPRDKGLTDIYDARVDGGFAEPSAGAAECEGEACQSPPEAPNDPTPASSAYEGAGNPVEPTARPCPKGKVRRHGRCVAKKHHKRAHRRANPNRRVTR